MGFSVNTKDTVTSEFTYLSEEDRIVFSNELECQYVEEARLKFRHEIKVKLRAKEAAAARVAKGLKANKITTYEIRLVLEDWLKRGCTNLKKSFQSVYDTTGKGNKEFDWVDGIRDKKYYGKELVRAVESSTNKRLVNLVNVPQWAVHRRELHTTTRLSGRITSMKEMLTLAETVEDLTTENTDLKAELARFKRLASWEYKAEELLKEGISQAKIAKEVGKGLATIQRLVKRLKEDGKL